MRPHETSTPEREPEAPWPAASPDDLRDPIHLTLPASLAAPAAARAAVGAWLAGDVSETVLADAQLVVAEIVANSVRHADAPAGSTVTVRAELRGDVVRVEVADLGTGGLIARRPPDLQHGGGFGLNLVEMLSRRWGVNRDAGARVWAELALAASDSGDQAVEHEGAAV
jgi:anti-sigma regulatory factor (Ser/Thr protein kinase)